MNQVNEPVAMVVNGDGEPIGFKWRNHNFLVASKPMRWFARRQWWKEAARANRGIGEGVVEVEMWRFMASDMARHTCQQFELLHQVHSNDWQLILVYP